MKSAYIRLLIKCFISRNFLLSIVNLMHFINEYCDSLFRKRSCRFMKRMIPDLNGSVVKTL